MADQILTAEIIECASCGKKNRVPAAANGIPSCGSCHERLPWMVDAGDQTFGAVVEQARLPVLVDFWAPWCGPCRLVSPALEQIAKDLAGRIKLVKVNVDESPMLQQRFRVQSIPSLMVFRNGQVAASQIGAAPAGQLRAWVNQSIT